MRGSARARLTRQPGAGAALLGLALLLATVLARPAAALPPGFTLEAVGSNWNEAVGMTFAADGRMYVWERGGRIWYVDANGQKSAQPVLDISDEVGGWRDYGLLGVALHENFLDNGYIYLLYVVDRHHLLHAGTPQYDPNADEYFAATIGRITRYTLESSTNFTTTDYNSRLVLLGATAEDGIPIIHQSHGTGSLVFGTDGTLLASMGDGASYSSTDTGSASETYYVDGLADGIIEPKENVGAFRAQMLGSLNGKILRLDPDTGAGLPSNPFYDPSDPFANISRVWALGLRNPYRFLKRPGTGSHDPGDGDPGVFMIGDVGWSTWEDVHVMDGPGYNFGWPNFEGIDVESSYDNSNTPNQEAPNPLYGQDIPGQGVCNQQFFSFSDLIIQATLDPNPSFPNPCDPSQEIPDTWYDGNKTWIYHKFVHRRPEVDYRHGSGPSRWTSWNGQDPATTNIGAAYQDPNGKSVPGPQFGGNTSTGGAFYTGGTSGGNYPAEYLGHYFHGDYGSQWIREFDFDTSNELQEVKDFHLGAGGVVDIAAHPITGDLYYIQWTANVWRIRYVGTGNLPPVAVASQDVQYGPTDLTVQFTGDQSSDPNDDPLSYDWDFGDGNGSTAANPSHTFSAPPGVPTAFTVTLTVDDGTDQDSTQLLVAVNDTPPAVDITSIPDGHLYSMQGTGEVFPLEAIISDAEQASGWTCEWRRALHHNDHDHPEPVITDCTTSEEAVFSPVGCDGNLYFYRVALRVTDDQGLVGEDIVDSYPDCPNLPPFSQDDGASVAQGYAVVVDVLANDSDPDGSLDPASVQVVSQPASGTTSVNLSTGEITYTHDGSPATSDSFIYTVDDDEGATGNQAIVSITAFNTPPTVTLDSPLDGSTFSVGSVISLQATADDAEDGAAVAVDWAVHRLHNDQLVEDVFTWSGPTPPDLEIPPAGVPGDRISYLIEVTATDVVGAMAVDRAHIVPASPPPNGAPTAAIIGSPVIGSLPLSFHGDGSPSSDPEGDYLLYDWDFGDGSTGFGKAVDHDYAAEGLYTVTLTVTDAGGAQSTDQIQVEVLSPGLEGVYYDNIDLTNDVLTRIDPLIDFDWGSGSPDPSIGANTFSVRWTGLIEPLYDETYTIYTVSDDGIRVWIDGQLVVDSWVDQAPTEHSGTITLQSGQRYDIVIEYYENAGGAVARLLWSSASQPKAVVAASQLFPPLPPNEPPYAVDDLAGTLSGYPVPIDVLANDFDDRDEIDPTTVVATDGAYGTTSVDPATGVVTYQHGGVTPGTDFFTYTVQDLAGATSNSATVIVNVLDPTTISLTSPTEGEVVLGPDITVTYDLGGDPSLMDHIHWTLDANPAVMQFAPFGSWDVSGLASGAHTLQAELADGQHSPLPWPGASQTVNFTVNLAPVASDDSATVSQAAAVPISVLLNDSDDVAFDPTTVVAGQGSKGTTSVHPTSGVVTYTHDGVSTGVDTFTYTVDDTNGATSNDATVTVTILNAAPVITAITGDLGADEGASFAYSATASDPGPLDPLTFEWDLDGDGQYDDFSETPGTGTQSSGGSTSLPDEGAYALGVRVSDGFGGVATDGFTVTVQNVDPSLDALTGDLGVDEGESFAFSATASDAGASDPLTFEWDLDGDGQYDDLSETPGTGTQSSGGSTSFGDEGAVLMGVRVSDGDGGEATGSFTVSVSNAAPTLDGLTGDLTVDEGESFAYSATASDAGTSDPLTFEWDLDGDGLYDDFSETPGTGTQSSGGTTAFSAESVFTLGVRVSDGDGGQVTGSFDVTVQNGDPWILTMAKDLSTGSGTPFRYWAIARDPGSNDVLTFEWDLDGDGQYDDFTETPAATMTDPLSDGTTSLATPGVYVLGVRVSDGEGGATTGSFEVTVTDAAMVPALSAPARALLVGLLLATALLGARSALEPRDRS
jgi:PKD repeat protein